MLVISDLTFRMAGRLLFDGASATVPTGRRAGVVGRNGSGKSTLFRLIEGALSPESGAIEMPKGWRVGGVAQEVPPTDRSMLSLVLEADRERAALMAEAETATDPTRIADIQMRLADIGAHAAEARAGGILSGLGFDAEMQARPSKAFSGGWRMRAALAGALLAEPDLLLLDEPTNYLDLEGAAWLETYLARYPRTALIISHDRGLLNRAVDSILHLDAMKLSFYATPFDKFDETRRARAASAQAAAAKQEAARAHMQAFVDRFRAKASKARQAQSRLKALERMAPISLSAEGAVAPFRFVDPEPLNPPIISLSGAAVGYAGAAVLSDLDLRVDPDDRIALLGANGQGKSTLLKLLAGALKPMAGDRVAASKLKIGFFEQHQMEALDKAATPTELLRRRRPDEAPAKLRGRLGGVGITGALGETPIASLSGGQRARVAMALCALDQPHLLILDEPTNHLDIESREALVEGLNAYDGALMIVSHDADLIARVADRLWLVEGGRVVAFTDDVENYRAQVLSKRRGAGGGGDAMAAKAREAKAAKDRASKDKASKDKTSDAPKRRSVGDLRREVEKAEARLEKLEAMRAEIDALLADPALYGEPSARLATLSAKREEILEGVERAESLWERAAAALEAAEAEAAR